jgi:hypothetical protein
MAIDEITMDQAAHQDATHGKRKHVSEDSNNDQEKSPSLGIATKHPRRRYNLKKLRRNQARMSEFIMRKCMEATSLNQTDSKPYEKPAPSSQPNEAQTTESVLQNVKEAISQVKREEHSSLADYEKLKNNPKENFGDDIERLIERNKRRQERLAQIEADLEKLTVMIEAK